MIKRGFIYSWPALLSLGFANMLLYTPSPFLSPVTAFYQEWASLLIWIPLFGLLGCVAMTIYFRSSRLGWLGLFLIGLYGYLFHDPLGFPLPTGPYVQPYRSSLMVFMFLIPLQFLVIHLSGTINPVSLEGGLLILSLVGEFLGILILFRTMGPLITEGLNLLTTWAIPIPHGGEIPLIPLSLLCLLAGVLWWDPRRNYYAHGQFLLGWMGFVTCLPFYPGFEWYLADDTPFHFYSAMGLTAFMLATWTLNYAWSKAYRDQLTQIRGRLALDERLERLSGTYTLAMIDIDEFKSFNDTYGHDDGDKVLKTVAAILDRQSSGDVYRFGGEEFTIVYTGRGTDAVDGELESLRQAVADNKVTVTRKSQRATKELEKRVTISLGAAEPSPSLDTPQKVLNAADEAMFDAKEKGRNQLILTSGGSSS
jgi:diguanylate cyclase (GGDEF)-like protein